MKYRFLIHWCDMYNHLAKTGADPLIPRDAFNRHPRTTANFAQIPLRQASKIFSVFFFVFFSLYFNQVMTEIHTNILLKLILHHPKSSPSPTQAYWKKDPQHNYLSQMTKEETI